MFWFLSPLLCCAPVCLVVAIVFFVQVSQNDVQGRIDQYNDVVEVCSLRHAACMRSLDRNMVWYAGMDDNT